MWYSSPVPWGIVQPHSSVEVPLTLEAQVTGEQDTVAHVAVFGSEGSRLVSSRGCGPLCDSSWWGVKRKAGLLFRGSFPGKQELVIYAGVDKERRGLWHTQQLMPVKQRATLHSQN